jgi:hypothetical protein
MGWRTSRLAWSAILPETRQKGDVSALFLPVARVNLSWILPGTTRIALPTFPAKRLPARPIPA